MSELEFIKEIIKAKIRLSLFIYGAAYIDKDTGEVLKPWEVERLKRE